MSTGNLIVLAIFIALLHSVKRESVIPTAAVFVAIYLALSWALGV